MSTWKPINGHPNYSVSTDGQVRNNKTGTILKTWIDTNGYSSLHLDKDIKRVHQLVAEAFIPNPQALPEINHIDGIKTNNHKDNLEWTTHSRNILHSYQIHGKHTVFRKAVVCLETGKVYLNASIAARAVNRSPMAIKKCLYGRTKTCAGLHWRYYYDCESRSNAGRESEDLWLCKSCWDEYYGIPEEQSAV